MPAAIGFFTTVTVFPRADRRLSVFSEHFDEEIEFDLDEPEPKAAGHWSDYVRGVAVALERSGRRLQGAALRIRGDIPIGAGLGSSAAIEVATARALLANSGFVASSVEVAQLCQDAENEFVGVRCGIMDHFTSCDGQLGQALLLDCRSLTYKLLPLPSDLRLGICNTMVKHELASSEYNVRRAQCEVGFRHFAQSRADVRALRDVTREELERSRPKLSEIIYRRCRHVITENARVLEGAQAIESGDLQRLGQLMYQSHLSLRDDYEVSCAELDLMVELAARIAGVFGTRMTGGGFGGCTISLLKEQDVEQFRCIMKQTYQTETGRTPEIYVCSAVGGAREVVADA